MIGQCHMKLLLVGLHVDICNKEMPVNKCCGDQQLLEGVRVSIASEQGLGAQLFKDSSSGTSCRAASEKALGKSNVSSPCMLHLGSHHETFGG